MPRSSVRERLPESRLRESSLKPRLGRVERLLRGLRGAFDPHLIDSISLAKKSHLSAAEVSLSGPRRLGQWEAVALDIGSGLNRDAEDRALGPGVASAKCCPTVKLELTAVQVNDPPLGGDLLVGKSDFIEVSPTFDLPDLTVVSTSRGPSHPSLQLFVVGSQPDSVNT